MNSNTWRARRSGAALLIACLAGADDLVAQQNLTGVYRSEAATVRLLSDGQATLFGPGGLSLGLYRVARDTIAFREDRGTATCPGETGFYLWRLAADTIRLTILSDPCDARRRLVGSAWTRMAGGGGPAGHSLTDVVITAERVEQDVYRVPVALTVLSGENARNAGVTRAQDLGSLVPGLHVGTMNGGAAMLYMRGVGNLGGTAMQDPTITFNFDGVYIARQTSTGGLYHDLERVEVLKGPQGTLYGRNATGGAVNVLPRRPQLKELGGELSVEYGTYASQNVSGWFNAPLGDRAAIRISGQRLRHDAYMEDATDDKDEWAGRLALRFDASPALALRVGADYFDQRGHGAGATPIGLGPDNRAGIASPDGRAYYATQRVTIAGRTWTPMPSVPSSRNQHWGANATIEWRTSLGAFTLVPAFRGGDIDAAGTAAGNIYSFVEENRQNTLEARLASTPHSRLHTLVGAFRFGEDIDLSTRPHNQFNVSFQHPRLGTTSIAPFGRVTWDVTDRFRSTLGARFTHEKKDFTGEFQSFSRICPPVPTAQCPNAQPFPADIVAAPLAFPDGAVTATPIFNPVDGTLTTGSRMSLSDSATFSRATWRAAMEYDVTRQNFLYGSYETGFKSGGFFFSNDSRIYDPEDVAALTFGVKSRLLDYRLQSTIEVFDWRYRDQQVSKISVDSRNVTSLATENIGRATIRGVEADLQYLLLDDTQVSANVQYLDAAYDSHEFVTPNSAGPPVTGCVVTPSPSGFGVNCSGRRAPYAPEWTVALGASQAFRFASGATLVSRSRGRYQSATLMGLDFLPVQEQAAHWLVDLSFTFATAGDRFSIGAFGQNVTDKTVLSNTFVVPFSTFTVGVLRPPRVLGMRVSARL